MRATISVLLICASAFSQVDSHATLDRQLQAILPSEDESAWLAAAWQPEFRTALLKAAELDKPVLLWAMNGHPLGQT